MVANIANPLNRIRFRRLPRIVRPLSLPPSAILKSEPVCRESRTMPQVVETAQITGKLALFRNVPSHLTNPDREGGDVAMHAADTFQAVESSNLRQGREQIGLPTR